MKERSKSKMAELLLEELLEQLKERGSLKQKLGDLTSLPVEEVIDHLLASFEQVVEKFRLESVEESRARKEQQPRPILEPPSFDQPLFESIPEPSDSDVQLVVATPRSEVTIEEPPAQEPSRSEEFEEEGAGSPMQMNDLVLDFPPIELQIPSPDVDPSVPPKQEPTDEKVVPATSRREVKPSQKEKTLPKKEPFVMPVFKPTRTERESEDRTAAEPEQVAAEPRPTPEPVSRHAVMPKVSVEFTDDDYVYLHAVLPLPAGETASQYPFMLEEKGIDNKSFAFAFDHEGLRFYLSKFSSEAMSVSKKGVLLLGKQETLQFQGVHENTLNDLRMHGTLLPFKFGSVARGRSRFLTMIDSSLDDIREAVAAIASTKWWMLNLYVLDARIAQLVGSQSAQHGREREERTSYVQTSTARSYDVKTLERILQKEKKIAEAVHDEVKRRAERFDIDFMVGLGSGSSDDWKLIFKASYEVAAKNLPNFNRVVTDLQYHHIMFDLMLSLTGDVEAFSFE